MAKDAYKDTNKIFIFLFVYKKIPDFWEVLNLEKKKRNKQHILNKLEYFI